MESQVRPRAKEGGQVDKRVKTQSVVAVVGQVGHEYAYLDRGKETNGAGMKRRRRDTTTERTIHFPAFEEKVKILKKAAVFVDFTERCDYV